MWNRLFSWNGIGRLYDDDNDDAHMSQIECALVCLIIQHFHIYQRIHVVIHFKRLIYAIEMNERRNEKENTHSIEIGFCSWEEDEDEKEIANILYADNQILYEFVSCFFFAFSISSYFVPRYSFQCLSAYNIYSGCGCGVFLLLGTIPCTAAVGFICLGQSILFRLCDYHICVGDIILFIDMHKSTAIQYYEQ